MQPEHPHCCPAKSSAAILTLLALLTLCAQQRLPPLRPPPQQQPDDASLFARATFGTLNPTLRLGFSRPLQQLDLPPLRREDSSRLATTQLDDELAALAATGSDKPRTVPLPPPAASRQAHLAPSSPRPSSDRWRERCGA